MFPQEDSHSLMKKRLLTTSGQRRKNNLITSKLYMDSSCNSCSCSCCWFLKDFRDYKDFKDLRDSKDIKEFRELSFGRIKLKQVLFAHRSIFSRLSKENKHFFTFAA